MAATLTITSQLLDGTLAGPRVIYSGSRMCKMFVSPRDCVLEIAGKIIPHQHAFYILLGSPGQGTTKAYIGQTQDFQARVRDHLVKKDYWDTALVFISKADEIYIGEVRYLEYLGIQKALEAGAFDMGNAQIPPEPSLAPEKKIEMEQFFEEIQFFLRFYGCSIFEKHGRKKRIVKSVPTPQPKQEESVPIPVPTPMPPLQTTPDQPFREYHFAIKKAGMSAKMRYYPAQKKYVVLAGSLISGMNAPSLQPSIASFRDELFSSPSKCVKKGDVYQLLEDIEIPGGSASAAAKFCAGTSRNGKTDWIDDNGHNIGEYLEGNIV